MSIPERFIDDFWKRIGRKKEERNSIAHVAVNTALFELIAHGTNGRNYFEFCNHISEKTGINADDLKHIYEVYRLFLLSYTDNALLSDMFFTRKTKTINTDYYDTLCFSAGYLRRVMRQNNYADKANPRYKAVAFTGPRPEKLPPNLNMAQLVNALTDAVNNALSDGYTVFYSGMSRGVDLIAANIILDIKMFKPGISLVCAIPFEGQADTWNVEDKQVYERIKSLADELVYVSKDYDTRSYYRRNEYMADHSDRLISVYDNKKGGGTGYTVAYAQKMGLEIVNINPTTCIAK